MALFGPGPGGFCWQCGRVPQRRETERQPKGQHAGGTPALPGGVVPMVQWGGYPVGQFSESRPAPFWEAPITRLACRWDGSSISANPGSNANALPEATRMPRTSSHPSPEKILCILCIHVNVGCSRQGGYLPDRKIRNTSSRGAWPGPPTSRLVVWPTRSVVQTPMGAYQRKETSE